MDDWCRLLMGNVLCSEEQAPLFNWVHCQICNGSTEQTDCRDTLSLCGKATQLFRLNNNSLLEQAARFEICHFLLTPVFFILLICQTQGWQFNSQIHLHCIMAIATTTKEPNLNLFSHGTNVTFPLRCWILSGRVSTFWLWVLKTLWLWWGGGMALHPPPPSPSSLMTSMRAQFCHRVTTRSLLEKARSQDGS